MTSLFDAYTATDKIKQVKLDYQKDVSLKSQILFTFENINLISVAKTYVDNEYLGIHLLFLVDKSFLKIFRDVNRGYSEDLVDDLDQLINFWHFKNTYKILNDAYISNQKITTKSFTFQHKGLNVHCEKIYVDDVYCFSNFHTQNMISRGAYSGKIFTTAKSFGIFIPTVRYSGEDNQLLKNYYIEKSYNGLSNTYSYVNTEYSTIKPTY